MQALDQLNILNISAIGKYLREVLSTRTKEHFSERSDQLRFLEAGCGQRWYLDLKGMNYHLTGIDLSQEALDIRVHQQHDLDEAIQGDLREVTLADQSYDLIYCAYVLEHIDGAEAVLDRFFQWLKPKGLLILMIPNRDSIHGFVTRITPFWFHVWFYRYILRYSDAGKPGHMPFHTFHDPIVSRRGIQSYCQQHGYLIQLEYGLSLDPEKVYKVPGPAFNLLAKSIEQISGGSLTGDHVNLVYVIEKGGS